ncbi:hypothetical protein HanRHA438_Chr01g0030811 [Helianthus annuus]|nr:hypothetical protein HanRHA438_Chr01g0030811 [Helianthus annuus]
MGQGKAYGRSSDHQKHVSLGASDHHLAHCPYRQGLTYVRAGTREPALLSHSGKDKKTHLVYENGCFFQHTRAAVITIKNGSGYYHSLSVKRISRLRSCPGTRIAAIGMFGWCSYYSTQRCGPKPHPTAIQVELTL